jgi:threonine/homoserine/homoserine lactone efflux protein
MPPLESLVAFFVATAVFAYIPGPAMLYTTAQTVARGQRAGWMAAFGIHIGGYAHVGAAAFGLAMLFSAVPVLYTVLKFAGGAYLIWMGVKLFTSKSSIPTSSLDFVDKTPQRAFWQSVTVEVLNPKTALFFVAFLPQFADPSAALPIWSQLLILGTIVNIVYSSADVVCVVLAGKVVSLFRGSRSLGRIAQRLGGSIVIALGLNVILHRQ